MHHLKSFYPRLESVLFRTLFLSCRVLDKFPRSDDRITHYVWQMQIVG